MDSNNKLIGRLQVTYWTILIRMSFKKKSLVYNTAYTRVATNHLKKSNNSFHERKVQSGIFQDTKHDINLHY